LRSGSPDFKHVLEQGLDVCLHKVERAYMPLYKLSTENEKTPKIEVVEEKPLASLLPEMSRTAHDVLNRSPNEFAKAVSQIPGLHAFAAVIFSSYQI